MKNIEEILKEIGIDIPEDKAEAFRKEVATNYKTIAEFEKKSGRITELETQLQTATDTLKSFEGKKPEELEKEIARLNKTLEDNEKEYNKNLLARDRKDAISKRLDAIKFTNKYSREAIERKIDSDEVFYKDGKLYGFDEKLKDLMESEVDAFVNEDAEQLEKDKVQFTSSVHGGKTPVSQSDISQFKTDEEREAFIKSHPDVFKSMLSRK